MKAVITIIKLNSIIGHKNLETGKIQALRDHLLGTAKLAKHFGGNFGEAELAELLGRYHDIGKYSKEFQAYIKNGGGKKVDHSTAGLQEFFKARLIEAAFCAGGHHGGLPNGGTNADPASGNSFFSKNKRHNIPDYQGYLQENEMIPPLKRSSWYPEICKDRFSWMLYTRMLFSCLVDADFLDTEEFMTDKHVNREGFASIDLLKERLDAYIKQNLANPVSKINKKRSELLTQCIVAGDYQDGAIKNLTIPTGGGKTIASLAFAMHAAVKQKKQRIIYIIPYTSIIEQTAGVFRSIIGSENVVEHHINVDYDAAEDSGNFDLERKRLATENWDAPVIVTTNVQFFESLFANKTSRCRKLHNIANSILIFDEAQMLPTEFLRPCTRAIEELTLHYGCIAVLCTATQPSLDSFFERQKLSEICGGVAENYAFFQRTTVMKPQGNFEMADLAEKLAQKEQVLCIVNTKRSAQELFDLLREKQIVGIYHLSTNLYPVHRSKLLTVIKKRLQDGSPCRVIATSLVEAGVDMDFPLVYRELAGLDSILQAAGRCNREGKHRKEASLVHIFTTPSTQKSRYMRLPREVTETVLREFPEKIDSPQAIERYFNLLHTLNGEAFLDKKDILGMSKAATMPFADIAKKFVLVENKQRPIYVPTEENATLTKQLKRGERSRALLRQAGKYMVNVYYGDMHQPYEKLYAAQKIEKLDEAVTILVDLSLYDNDKGLIANIEDGQDIFM